MNTDRIPKISARWEWMSVIHPKSGFTPSIMGIPVLSEMNQAPPTLFLDLLTSKVFIICYFNCIKVTKGSTFVFSLNWEINVCCQDGNDLIYCLKVISLDGTVIHIWNSGSILPFPFSICNLVVILNRFLLMLSLCWSGNLVLHKRICIFWLLFY